MYNTGARTAHAFKIGVGGIAHALIGSVHAFSKQISPPKYNVRNEVQNVLIYRNDVSYVHEITNNNIIMKTVQ
jgi:hypothetical protein